MSFIAECVLCPPEDNQRWGCLYVAVGYLCYNCLPRYERRLEGLDKEGRTREISKIFAELESKDATPS